MADPDVLRDLFDRAVSLPPRERASFLVAACADDLQLRAEVERLLAADAGAASLFGAGPDTDASDPSPTPGKQAPSPPLAPGTRFGVYVIEALVGLGGMGEVYRARDARLGRTVALKVLPLALSSDPVARHRFEREARSIAALSDPHICPLFDIGREGDRDYLVMEFLHGQTLAARLREGRLPLADALGIAIEIAGALSTAHQSGIVHRDLKPGNVMLTRGGVRLLDFGLARHTEHRRAEGRALTTLEPLTGTGVILGTLPYMAPEQLEGEPADARTDVFAFGAALYEMVTGRRAFDGATDASVIGNILHAEPPAPSTITPLTPKQLDLLVRRCLAKDPAARPSSMADLHAQLLAIREQVLARDGYGRPRSAVTRRLGLIGTTALLVFVAVAAWRRLPLTSVDAPRSGDTAEQSDGPVATASMGTVPLTTLRGGEDGPSFAPDGTHVAFAWTPPARNDSRILVKRVGDDDVREITQGAWDGAPAWSPDGRLIAFSRNGGCNSLGAAPSYREKGGLYVVPALGGPVRRVFRGALCGGPAWSPDGRTIVFSAEPTGPSTLVELSMETLAIRRLTSAGSWALAPTFSPDGQNLAFVVAEPRGSDLYLLRGRQGTPERLTSDHALITGLTWAPDNRAIFFASNRNGSFEVWQIRPDGTHLDRLSIAADGGLTIDRSGRRLAYSLGSRGLQMHITSIDMHGAPPRSVAIAESTRSEFSATYSADGKKIAFASDRGGNRMDIWIADADGWNPIRLTSFGKGFTGSPRFSPDGEWVAFDAIVDGRHFDIYTVRTGGGEPRRLTSGSSNNSFPCWSRDGRWIYFGSDRTGNEQVWKMRSDGEQPVQITKNGGTGGFESSDGRYLYYSKGNGGPGIWRVAVQSGTEEPVLPSDPVGAYVRDWTLVDNRLYFLKTRDREQQSLEVLDLDTKSVRRVLDLPGAACPSYSPEVAVSPDHRTLLTCFEHPAQSDLMLAENVR